MNKHKKAQKVPSCVEAHTKSYRKIDARQLKKPVSGPFLHFLYVWLARKENLLK
jgi:hypothetical protein